MLSWIREKFGTAVIGGIISFIAFVFVFYGVFSPKATRGLHEGAVAGTVNGDAISIGEFNRELNRRMEFFKKLGGGNLTDEQLKSFRVREGVFQELAQRKVLVQEARKQGLLAADDEVKDRIMDIPAFQKDGKFDFTTYKQVLEANNYNPGSFEKLMRDDLSAQQWDQYFQDRVHVSDDELKHEFLINQDKRNIKYVLLTPESAKDKIAINDSEVQKFLADPAKLNLAKMKFEDSKNTLYKGQKFEDAKHAVARSILASEKVEEIQKINNELADQIIMTMTAHASSDAKVNALLKTAHAQVKTTGLITRKSAYIPEVGEAKELIADAFSAKSPIDPQQGGKAKKYSLVGRTVIALVTDSQKPDLARFEGERDNLMKQMAMRKMRTVYQDWVTQTVSKAKIDTNPSVVGSAGEAN